MKWNSHSTSDSGLNTSPPSSNSNSSPSSVTLRSRVPNCGFVAAGALDPTLPPPPPPLLHPALFALQTLLASESKTHGLEDEDVPVVEVVPAEPGL